MYNVQELATAAQYGITVVAVVFNDRAYGNVKRIQRELYGNRVIASDLTNPDFVRAGRELRPFFPTRNDPGRAPDRARPRPRPQRARPDRSPARRPPRPLALPHHAPRPRLTGWPCCTIRARADRGLSQPFPRGNDRSSEVDIEGADGSDRDRHPCARQSGAGPAEVARRLSSPGRCGAPGQKGDQRLSAAKAPALNAGSAASQGRTSRARTSRCPKSRCAGS